MSRDRRGQRHVPGHLHQVTPATPAWHWVTLGDTGVAQRDDRGDSVPGVPAGTGSPWHRGVTGVTEVTQDDRGGTGR